MLLALLLIFFPCSRLHGCDCHCNLPPVYSWEGGLSTYQAVETPDGVQIVARLDTRPGPGYLVVELHQDRTGIAILAYDTHPAGNYCECVWFPNWGSVERDGSMPVALLMDAMSRAKP